ncbi:MULTISPECIES: hypothetical protein [unclassified Leptolyngbya]|uniref:hypothetical protein n=1 Tax=unclassified Leptolyngbya TaxID=2650499 RepID=UPI0018EF4765|nr:MULTISPECIES: hypothetical protein [unclassified Leptolyngbya]
MPKSLWFTPLALALFLPLPAQAQQIVVTGGSSIFENVSLSPNFANATIRGISGGPVSATQLARQSETDTGACLGFVDEQPDHTMQLTSRFSYLSLQVQSTADTTLVVRGPGGTWCNDNYSLDFNPGMSGEWLPGTYEIWVGSHRVNRYYPYVIQISESNPIANRTVPVAPPVTAP